MRTYIVIPPPRLFRLITIKVLGPCTTSFALGHRQTYTVVRLQNLSIYTLRVYTCNLYIICDIMLSILYRVILITRWDTIVFQKKILMFWKLFFHTRGFKWIYKTIFSYFLILFKFYFTFLNYNIILYTFNFIFENRIFFLVLRYIKIEFGMNSLWVL